ncbi:CaiB/BaiF CoA-transferase family protein [Alicyclobacillus sp. SO9]|uniref:CaiB/BaiF CoA transferase family protein n=1 Tax=Alicyclobacillus sp. SO9 TaxID=2665646 RepID=UPI0018E8E539|nr:CaiB/BaiF CoA-transferase family protein [Alicyclobacillus sp. SO9]QQE80779.1 CoA transferase [Alicyclobacillus sp. SO9]
MADFLTGTRIIDMTRLLPGPYATLRLAEMGAEVIKVEDINWRDPARYTGPADESGKGLVFLANHRGKESVTIDIQSAAGHEQLLQLIQSADVLMEGFRPGRMKQFGLDYETLRQSNPRLILCSLTGYGQHGPLSQTAGHDLNYMAVSGLLSLMAGPNSTPHPPSVQLADMIGGMAASEAVLAALIERHRTGQGRHIDISMTAALLGLLPVHTAVASSRLGEYGIEELTGSRVCYGIYQTKDAKYMALGALEPKFWRAFCENVHHAEWVPKQFEQAVNGNAVYEEIKAAFLNRTEAEWREFAANVDCCLSPVHNLPNALAQAEASQLTYFIREGQSAFTSIATAAGGIEL